MMTPLRFMCKETTMNHHTVSKNALLFLSAASVQASTVAWLSTAPLDATWGDGANWEGGVAPAVDDTDTP